MTERWRKLPENPEYELSNHGRLRGPGGLLCMPDVSAGSVRKARYAVPVGRERNSARARLLVSDLMKRVWKVGFEPSAQWVSTVRAEILVELEKRRSGRRKAKARYAAKHRARGAAAQDNSVLETGPEGAAAPLNLAAALHGCEEQDQEVLDQVDDGPAGETDEDRAASSEELWRVVPNHPRYQLSNRGRMRGHMGALLKPVLNGASALGAKYQLWASSPFRRSVSYSIRQGMLVVWGIRFAPTFEWVKEVQAQVFEEAKFRAGEMVVAAAEHAAEDLSPEASPAKERSAPSRPDGGQSGDGMPCPWASGKLDALPPGIVTWDCPEMDPMTYRGQCRVWVCVHDENEQRSEVAA